MTALALKVRHWRSQLSPLFQHLDRVWLTIAGLFVVLALVNPNQAQSSFGFVLASLQYTGPYLALSILIAAYAGASGADALIARAFTGRTALMILTASVFGALSPFCSCGVIPLIAALLVMGVPLAPVMAFWLASPIIDPSMFVLTSGLLGPEFAIAKTVAAIGLGLMGGFGVLALARGGWLADPLREGISVGCGGSRVTAPKPPVWAFWREQDRLAKFSKEAMKTALFLGKWLTLAFLLESLMLAFVPADVISTTLGGEGLAPILTATFVGVPAYLNGYAALPLVAGLIEQGMAPGAGMAFLVAGGVTSIPAAIAVFALVKRPVFGLYLVFSLTGALISGLTFQAFAG